ncbi:hypothetical protein CYMTET_20904 [Cymbomonas tetramitiformis]|uniref:Uncharacterized protein n=1 Tax=Cymbomonas tetramitiformis TaxID=36881 RepID=A0AAE0G3M2_9CHLO|nr:hypothetical protein CYMTET_20904 [Cymbomonas tetramitiformis]
MADIFTKAKASTKHGIPLVTKRTAELLNIKDRKVKLREQLRAAAEQQQLAAAEQQQLAAAKQSGNQKQMKASF